MTYLQITSSYLLCTHDFLFTILHVRKTTVVFGTLEHILVHPKRVIRRNIPDDSKVLETKNKVPTSKDKYIIQHYVNVPTVRPIIQTYRILLVLLV